MARLYTSVFIYGIAWRLQFAAVQAKAARHWLYLVSRLCLEIPYHSTSVDSEIVDFPMSMTALKRLRKFIPNKPSTSTPGGRLKAATGKFSMCLPKQSNHGTATTGVISLPEAAKIAIRFNGRDRLHPKSSTTAVGNTVKLEPVSINNLKIIASPPLTPTAARTYSKFPWCWTW